MYKNRLFGNNSIINGKLLNLFSTNCHIQNISNRENKNKKNS